ncbi:MAG: hypothetical protein EXS16_19895 [Gemmataceae bacterium]|nr:hypothetical protein [Gemmataceae bacterium]
MKTHPVLALLKKACDGLLFTSETDAQLEPFVWDAKDAPTPKRLAEISARGDDPPIEKLTLAAFFRAVPKSDKAKFDALAKQLQEHLGDLEVHKVGEVNLAVFIIGKTNDGKWAGLRTEVVET